MILRNLQFAQPVKSYRDDTIVESTTSSKKDFPWPQEKIRTYLEEMTYTETVKGQYFTRFFFGLFIRFVRFLSWKSAHKFGSAIGRLMYLFKVRKDTAMINLDIAYGDSKTKKEKEAIYKASLMNMGSHVLNYARVPLMDEGFWRDFEFEGKELIDEVYNRGKGIIFIGGHIGEWEIAAGRIGMEGYPISIVAKRQPNPFVNRFINDARLGMNLGTIKHLDSINRVIEGLKRGEGVIMAVDQNMKKSQGVFVKWLSRSASTVRSNAWVARETGAPVVAGFAYRTAPGKFKLVITEEVPWEPCPEDPDKELLINTQNQARAVEKIILDHPEQWLWIHRRWKVQPDGVVNPYEKG